MTWNCISGHTRLVTHHGGCHSAIFTQFVYLSTWLVQIQKNCDNIDIMILTLCKIYAIWISPQNNIAVLQYNWNTTHPYLYGLLDSGVDITIVRSIAFKQVVTVTKLQKQDFKPLDKAPKSYDLKPFHVDGINEIDIEFQDKAMTTHIYICENGCTRGIMIIIIRRSV